MNNDICNMLSEINKKLDEVFKCCVDICYKLNEDELDSFYNAFANFNSFYNDYDDIKGYTDKIKYYIKNNKCIDVDLLSAFLRELDLQLESYKSSRDSYTTIAKKGSDSLNEISIVVKDLERKLKLIFEEFKIVQKEILKDKDD